VHLFCWLYCFNEDTSDGQIGLFTIAQTPRRERGLCRPAQTLVVPA
jgi:hypothetical protein